MSPSRQTCFLTCSLLLSLTVPARPVLGEEQLPAAAAGAPVLKDKAPAKPKTALTAEGTFTGIEQGDYMHWKMHTKAGDVSYFILKPDASVEKVLKNPKPFTGRKCRITWKKTTENIPEAGGKMEIEQIVSVEWTDKK